MTGACGERRSNMRLAKDKDKEDKWIQRRKIERGEKGAGKRREWRRRHELSAPPRDK